MKKTDPDSGTKKNVVHGSSIQAGTVRIGDDHYHISSQSILPKKLSIDIPSIAPDALVGREQELQDLRARLLERRESLLLNGLGGIGKTTLAMAYVQRHWDEYRHLVWITQSPGGNLMLDFITNAGLRQNLGIPDDVSDAEQLFSEILRRLNAVEAQPNLLVLDNAETGVEQFRSRLPAPPNWHVLLTSREEIEGFSPMALDFLKPEAAFELFKKHYTRRDLSDEQIKTLVEQVDFHTLTIEILAKTADVQRYDFHALSQALARDARANVKVSRPNSEKIERVTSFLAGIFSMSRLTDDETWLLQQFACLPSDYHTYDLLRELTNPDACGRGEIFAETLHELRRKGWLLSDTAQDSYKMHLVVAEAVKKTHPPDFEAIKGLMEQVTIKLGIDQTKDNPVDKFPWEPFGKALLESVEEFLTGHEAETAISNLQNNLALVFQTLGDYSEAKSILEKALASDERNFNLLHPSVARSYTNLAMVLQDLGDYVTAIGLLEKAVASDEHNFGSEHPSTTRSYSNLATVLIDLGDYARARALLEKAVESDERNFGPLHPTTTIRYSNLALVFKALGDYKSAKTLMQKVVESNEHRLGPMHPSTAISYSNLAMVLKDLGDYASAKGLMEKAVASDEYNFGASHPTTTGRYSNLALILKALGEFEDAKALFKKALSAAENTFGPLHPTTGVILSNLALVLQSLRDFNSAKALLEKAIAIVEYNFGPQHPSSSVQYTNLAMVLKDLRDYEGAKELLEKALDSTKRNFSSTHPYIAKILSYLALVLIDLGDYAGAKDLMEKALESDEQNFGPLNPNTARSYSNLATVLFYLKEYQEALNYSAKSLDVFEKILPPDHPHLTTVKNNLEFIRQHIS